MNLKKVTAIFLAVLMICVSFISVIPVSAATTVCKILPPEGQSFPDGTVTEFATIKEAMTAINSSSSQNND